MSDVQQTLHDRGASHGDFAHNAQLALALRELIDRNLQFKRQPLQPTEAAVTEALNAVAGKFARILAGDPMLIDHWRDIIGYSQLAIDQLMKDPAAIDVRVSAFHPGAPAEVASENAKEAPKDSGPAFNMEPTKDGLRVSLGGLVLSLALSTQEGEENVR